MCQAMSLQERQRCRKQMKPAESSELAGHAAAARCKLFGNGAMTDYHTLDGGRVIGMDKQH